MPVLGLDTSNYTTSAAIFDGERGRNVGRLLDVRPGELGLRQSDELFQQVKRLPLQREELLGGRQGVQAVGASTRPRAVDGSYMPCFWQARARAGGLPRLWESPFMPTPTSKGIWPPPPGPPGGRSCWTPPSWPGICPEARPNCCL